MGIINSLFWKFLERFCSQILGFAIQIILARIIEPTEFGTLAIVMALINITSIFIQNGISTYIVVKKDLDDVDIVTTLCTSMLIAMVGYLILFIFSPLFETYYSLTNLATYIRIMSVVLFLYAFNAVYTGLLERNMQFKTLFFRSVLGVPISGGVGVWMAYSGYGIYSLIAQTLLNQFILSIILFWGIRRRFRMSFSLERAKKVYHFCIPVMIQSAVGELVNMLKSLTISRIYSREDLAYYDKGSSYSSYIYQAINTPIVHVLLPTFSRYQNNIEILRKNYLETLRLNNLVSLPIIIGFAAISDNFVTVFLTEKWIFAVDFISAFCIIRAIYISINLNVQIFYVLKMSRQVMQLSVVITALSFIAYFIVRTISPMTIVIGEIIVTLFFWVCTVVYIKKYIGASIKDQVKGYIHPILGTILMTVSVVQIDMFVSKTICTLVLQILVGTIVYVGYSLLFQRKDLFFMINRIKTEKKQN